ncbi:MAG: non-homologous end joining protein Ku [Alphaproteobacteria bacterium]
MPARAYWSGQIRLALVSIPVQLFSATKSAARISFNQIHKPSGKRIRYEKVVPGVGAIDTEEIVRGYEVEKGKYVLFEDQEIDDVKLEAKRTIDLVQFVNEDEIDPVFFDKPLYVAPDEDEVAGEAYVVLRDALRETGKVGLGQVVVRGKASIVCLKPHGKGLVIETLRYVDEVNKADQYFADVPDVEPEEELRTLAEELIKRKVKPFDAKAFKDPYDVALRELIQAKLEDRPPEEIDQPEVGAQVINLMDALKKSMSAGKSRQSGTKSRTSKTAAKSTAAQSKSGSAKGSRSKSDDKKAGTRGRRAA